MTFDRAMTMSPSFWILAVIATLLVGMAKAGFGGAATPTDAVAWGALSGFASFLAHAGGPPLLHYLMPLRLEKTQLLGTVTIFFAAVNFAKLAPYSHLGLIDLSSVAISMLLLPAVPIGF